MPYIPQVKRPEFDPHIIALAQALAHVKVEGNGYDVSANDHEYVGNLNYCITRLILMSIKMRFGKLRYWLAAEIHGAMGHIATEFYRRKVVPYEQLKIKENGDVPEYEEEW